MEFRRGDGERGGRGRGRGDGGGRGQGGSQGGGHGRGQHGGGRGSGSRGGSNECPGYVGKPRGGGARTIFNSSLDPYDDYNDRKLDEHGRLGWLHTDTDKELTVQQYTGPPTEWALNRIHVSVNHYLVQPLEGKSKTAFPIPTLYHYDIHYDVVRERRNPAVSGPGGDEGKPGKTKRKRFSDRDQDVDNLSQRMEGTGLGDNQKPPGRKLSKQLSKAVLDYLIPRIRRQHRHHAIATDGSSNLYTTRILESIPIPLEHQVSFADLRSERLFDEDDNAIVNISFLPSLTPRGNHHAIDTTDISRYVQSKGTLRGYQFSAETRQTLEAACNAFVKSMPNFQYFSVGRSSMVPCENAEQLPLGGGLVAWKGLSANIAMGWKPYLNVDIANCAFILNRPVFEVLREVIRGQNFGDVTRWNYRQLEEVRSLLRTCKVRYTIDGMVRGGPIRDIPKESASQQKFQWEQENGQMRIISVYDYYRERYGRRLTHSNGPLLELRKKGTYVPAELCTIKAGQSYNRKLDGQQTTNMLDFAKRNPQQKVTEITQKIDEMELQNNQVIRELGIQISSQMLNIKEARVLVPPSLRYGPGKGNVEVAHINPQGGTWEVWRVDKEFSFYKPATINRWGVLVVDCPYVTKEEVQTFVLSLKRNGARKGVSFVNKPDTIKLDKTDRRNTTPLQNANDFSGYFKNDFGGCDLVVVVIPEKGHPLYGHVKHAAEVDAGILTQCVIRKHVSRVNDSVVQNIILKINTKMNGTNHVTVKPLLEPSKARQFCTVLLDCPVMILGADVTHAPPGSKKVVNGEEFIMPSYAAVTGSLDPTCMPFMTEIRAQRKLNAGAAEVIQDLEEITFNMLQCYKATWKGNKMPRKIIYFRDGVGEGQFPELLHIEMNAIRRACKRVGQRYEPKITFITVQKRHKTRMFHHVGGRIENVPAGTVVDTEIVHPTETDFYLCSHKGMLGTSRPSRYHVLWDDSEFTQDQLQSLAYTLCYMYARCTKSVKMPAATYYAHLAADRAKKLCEGFETKYGKPTDENLNKILKRSGLSKYPMHFV